MLCIIRLWIVLPALLGVLCGCSQSPSRSGAGGLIDSSVSDPDLAHVAHEGILPLDWRAPAEMGAPGDTGLPTDVGKPTLPACTKTIGSGDSIVANIGGPGSVLCLESGVYNQTVHVNKSGTANNPITIRAAPGAAPVIDGKNSMPGDQWTFLVELIGDHIVVDGLEIRNSAGQGAGMIGRYNTISHCKVHHTYQAGLYAIGDDNIIENNEVYECCQVNVNGKFGPEGWPVAIGAARDQSGDGITERTIIRGNISHDNWGEGIDSYEADGTLIEGNVAYNNWSIGIYISNSPNTIARNNLTYSAQSTKDSRPGHDGFHIADELQNKPLSSNVQVFNNVTFNADMCELCWTYAYGQNNVNVHHNTIVNGTLQVDGSVGTNIIHSANCTISQQQVPGLTNVTPGSLTLKMFASAKCPAGTGASLP